MFGLYEKNHPDKWDPACIKTGSRISRKFFIQITSRRYDWYIHDNTRAQTHINKVPIFLTLALNKLFQEKNKIKCQRQYRRKVLEINNNLHGQIKRVDDLISSLENLKVLMAFNPLTTTGHWRPKVVKFVFSLCYRYFHITMLMQKGYY